MSLSAHAASNSAMNSDPPSTCTASTVNGAWRTSLSRKRAALAAVALEAGMLQLQREAVDGGEVSDGPAGPQRHGEGVDLHRLSGPPGPEGAGDPHHKR